jgi:hypothetical protein
MKWNIVVYLLLFTTVCAAWRLSQTSLVPNQPEQPTEEDEKGRQFRRLHLAYASRFDRKDQVVQRFVVGELTLPEAAAHFRSIDRDSPELPRNVPYSERGQSEEETYCRQVISWTRASLAIRDPDAALRVAPVEKWLDEEIRAHGRLLLPEVDLPPYADGQD